jgi:hypothetical protein
MEKEQIYWKDKEQCEGGTRNNGREGQGTVGGKLREQWEGRTRNSEEGTRNSGEINRKKRKPCRQKTGCQINLINGPVLLTRLVPT